MNWKNLWMLIVAISSFSIITACQSSQSSTDNPEPHVTTTLAEPSAISIDPTVTSTTDPTPMNNSASIPLPERSGPLTQTSGTVPHVQIGVEPIIAINDELLRRAFALPGVENRPTIVSLPGALGMWLGDDIPLAHPEVIVAGREFAHIHPDGSLHAPLPFDRALEVAAKGWGERHPWADEREGWDGLVMIFTPQSMSELDIVFQLVIESYNHVTGQTIQASDY
jgi:hypothetical protein